MAAAAPTQPAAPWPLYDLFLDVPHPAASKSCPPPFLIASPVQDPALSEELARNIPQMARFAFPEYDEAIPEMRPHPELEINRFDKYAMSNEAFQHFTFSLQLQSGTRLHGHVRRGLPPHRVAKTRYDVGRRGERALIIITRASGADLLYSSILKSIEAISSQQSAMKAELRPHGEPQKWFLHQLFKQHQQLAREYATKPLQERGRPSTAEVIGLEIGGVPLFSRIDTNRFIIPTSLLYRLPVTDPSASQSTSILPVLRCLGVENSIRLMSALLSERRVILVSNSPTRLASCSHAALSMLAQGQLHWQHLFIPVLPPHLWQYLAAPYPYLIGILNSTYPRLDRTDGLGEVLIIQLDTNNMETRGIEQHTVLQRLPDLFQNQENALQGGAASPSEHLGQSLIGILKNDKKILYGESTLANMGETAAKATKAVKKTLSKLRDRGRQYLARSGSNVDSQSDLEEINDVEPKTMAPDYIYTEGCYNEFCEKDARAAFATFFLCMFGDMRWYLAHAPGQPPQLDPNRFLHTKRSLGEGEGTPIWSLLKNFCQSQMFHEFAKARIEEVRIRRPITPDDSLFLQCAYYHRQHNVDFGLLSVRRTIEQVAERMPSPLSGFDTTDARKIAMALTSNRQYEADYNKDIALLVEQCRESSSCLFDVMSVIWLRLRDSRGMQWKHGFHALQILKNLLYHGPLAVIAEATDGLDKIRDMRQYENMRGQNAQQIRTVADNVYEVLVDRAKLFHIRRVCAEKRRQLRTPPKPLQRDRHLNLNVPFRNMHAALSPSASGTIVRIPPTPPVAQNMGNRGTPALQQTPTQAPPEVDLFAAAVAPAPSASSAVAATGNPFAQDMAGLFDNMAIGTVPTQTIGSVPSQPLTQNPFEQLASPVAPAPSAPAPQQVSMPPVQSAYQQPQVHPQQGFIQTQTPATTPNQDMSFAKSPSEQLQGQSSQGRPQSQIVGRGTNAQQERSTAGSVVPPAQSQMPPIHQYGSPTIARIPQQTTPFPPHQPAAQAFYGSPPNAQPHPHLQTFPTSQQTFPLQQPTYAAQPPTFAHQVPQYPSQHPAYGGAQQPQQPQQQHQPQRKNLNQFDPFA